MLSSINLIPAELLEADGQILN